MNLRFEQYTALYKIYNIKNKTFYKLIDFLF